MEMFWQNGPLTVSEIRKTVNTEPTDIQTI